MPLTVDVPAVLCVLVLGTLYVRAARRRGWPPGRTTAFLAGLATIVLVTCSPLAVYDTTFFWVRAVQTITLLMITPLLLVMGAPVRLLLDTVPARWLRRHGRGPVARALTFPPVVTVVLVAPVLVLYLTPLYDLTLRSSPADGLVRVILVGAGFVYFWTRLGLDPTPREDPHLVSVWIAFTEVIFDGALGLVLWLGPLLAPAHYAAAHPGWGPDPRTDQIIGAGVLWIGGDVAGLPFIAALFVRWARDDERRAKRIDAQLDEEAASAPPGLWWENDPALAERFKRR